MVDHLRREIRQRGPFASRAEEAFLNLLRSAALLDRQHARFFEPYGLTPTQYNALRILRGAHPERLPCREVGERMVAPVPDVTRLLDRLQAKGLVARRRSGHDRRVVEVGISRRGRELLARIDGPLAAWLEDRLGHLGPDRLDRLSRLLARARGPKRRGPGSGGTAAGGAAPPPAGRR